MLAVPADAPPSFESELVSLSWALSLAIEVVMPGAAEPQTLNWRLPLEVVGSVADASVARPVYVRQRLQF